MKLKLKRNDRISKWRRKHHAMKHNKLESEQNAF